MSDPQVLTDAQIALRDEIISTGRVWGFTENQIDIAVRVAFKESAFGARLENSSSTASGLFQYTNPTWSDFYSHLNKASNADQIFAFYSDMAKYQGKYLEAIAAGALPSSVTFGQFVYVMHHDGRYTPLSSVATSAAIDTFNKIADYYYEGMQQPTATGAGSLGGVDDSDAQESWESSMEFWAMLGDVPIYDLRLWGSGGGGVGDTEYYPPEGGPPIIIPGDVSASFLGYI